MRQGPGLKWISVFVFFVSFLFTPQSLNAQAAPAASKEGEFSAYGAYTYAWPDYGPGKDNGAIFGGEYTRFMNRFLNPSLEVRGKVVAGATVDERTWGGGIRGVHRFRNFYPYINFLVSSGTIHSITVSSMLSAGSTNRITPSFTLPEEVWTMTSPATSPPASTPEALSIGVVYHLSPHNR